MQAKKSVSSKETPKSTRSSGKQESLPAQAAGQEWEQTAALGRGPNQQSQAARLADSRVPAVQRQSLARQIGRLQGNLHLSRLLSQPVSVSSNSQTVIQRRALGAVANQTLGTIRFTRQGNVPGQATLRAVEELVLSTDQPGRFAGFSKKLEGYGQAWRDRDKVTAVVQDSDGKYHALKTDFPGRGVVDSLRVQPAQHAYRHLWWVNLPRVAPGEDAAALAQSWTDRADRAMNWYDSWKDRQVPPGFSCPHGGQHGANLNGVRSCLETEFAALLADALDMTTRDVHIIPSGGRASSTTMVNFNLELHDKANSGIVQLPTDRTSAAPTSTLTIGPAAFENRSEAQLVGTAVHESTHVSHAEQGLQWRERWRAANTRASFPVWLRGQMRRGRLNQEQFDLVIDQTRRGDKPNTEAVSHLNGFMAGYHNMPINRTIARFEQLNKVPPYWGGVTPTVKASFTTRLTNYYRGLDAAYQRDFAAHARQKARSSIRAYSTFWGHVVSRVLR
jgi:hypothetical protein